MEVQKPGEELVSVRQKEKKMGASAGKSIEISCLTSAGDKAVH